MLTVAARCRSLGSRLGQRQLSCATLARQVMQDPDLLCCWRAAEPSRAAAGRLPPGRVANISMRRTSSPRLQCNRPIEGRRLACEEAVRSPARAVRRVSGADQQRVGFRRGSGMPPSADRSVGG